MVKKGSFFSKNVVFSEKIVPHGKRLQNSYLKCLIYSFYVFLSNYFIIFVYFLIMFVIFCQISAKFLGKMRKLGPLIGPFKGPNRAFKGPVTAVETRCAGK